MATFQRHPDRKKGPFTRVIIRKRGHVVSKIFGTKAAAERWAIKVEAAILDGLVDKQIAIREQMTVGEILEWYITRYITGCDPIPVKDRKDPEIPEWKSPATWKNVDSTDPARAKNIWRHDIAKISTGKVTVQDIQRFVDDRMEAVTAATAKRDVELLRAAFNRAAGPAKGVKFPDGNPAVGIELPEIRNSRVARTISEDEYDYIEATAIHYSNEEALKVIELARETAMRRGEVLKLNADMIERAGDMVLLLLPPEVTKTKESRYVPLTHRAIEILGSLTVQPDGSLFSYHKEGFKTAWRRIMARALKLYEEDMTLQGQRISAKFLRDLRFHDFRGTEASRLAAKGWSLSQIAAVTGHRDLTTLRKFYAQVDAMSVAERLQRDAKT